MTTFGVRRSLGCEQLKLMFGLIILPRYLKSWQLSENLATKYVIQQMLAVSA